MSNVLLWGDLHAGAEGIVKYRTCFRDEQDMFEHYEIEYHKRVTKRDKCIFLGDIACSEERLAQIAKWKGEKVLVMGNHDTDRCSIQSIVNSYDSVHALVKYKEFYLSHAPIHEQELRGKANIHGHVHDKSVKDINYFNACVDNIGHKPIALHEIRKILADRRFHYEEYGYYNIEWEKEKLK